TPGVAVAIGDRTISISFEPGTSILFGAAGEPSSAPVAPAPAPSPAFAEPPEPFPGNSAARTQGPELVPTTSLGRGGRYFLTVGPTNDLVLQGKPFVVVDESAKAHLLIDAQKLREVVKSKKVLSGVRLPSK